MKNFIKKTTLLIILLIAISFLQYFIFGIIEKTKYRDSYPENSLAIIGHSHPSCAINDSLLSRDLGITCENHGVNGQGMFWSIIGGRKLCNQGLKHVLIEVSNNTYTTNWKTVVERRALNELHKKYFIKPTEWLDLLHSNPTVTIKLFMRQTLPRKRVTGSFFKNKLTFVPKQVEENSLDSGDYKFKVDFNDEIIHNLIEENPSISFFVIRAPQHPRLYDNLTDSNEHYLINQLSKFRKHKNCIVMDFGHTYSEDKLFADLGHMNNTGADIFTKHLADSLDNYISLK